MAQITAQVVADGSGAAFGEFKNRGFTETARKRRPLKELPVIDIGPFVTDSSDAERRRTADEIKRACIDMGFLCITGHPIPQSEFDTLIEWGHRLFALPLEDKLALGLNDRPGGTGYVRMGGNQAPDAQKSPDVKERFIMSRDRIPGEPEEGSFSAGQTVWPAPDKLDGFANFMRAHIGKRTDLARQIIRAFALSLDLDEGYFDEMYRYPGATMVFNHYPAVSPGDLTDNQWSFSPHTDYGMFTMLVQDRSGGLQARNADGDWLDVPPIDGAFVINIGDLFAMWTNDHYASSLHRVMNYTDAPRISAPMFTYPQGRTRISCLPTCHGPNDPARHEPVIAEDYNNMLIAQAHRTGRPGLSTHTAERFEGA